MFKTRFISMLALLMTAATGAWAQEQWDVVWDFTAWSTETVTALKADAAASKTEGWSDVEKQVDAESGVDPTAATKDNCFWSCSAGTVNADGNLSANGAVIKEFQGLKFNSDYAAQRKLAIAVNYPIASTGTYHGPAYLWLGGSKQTCFTIPGVKAGSKITIEVESHNTSSARGIGLYKNSYAAENLIGEQFTPKTLEAKTWEIAEDCDVVVSNTNSCHIYTIKVKAPAAAPSSGYTVTMKDDVKDAEKWTVKVGEGQAQALPIGGLKGDGSETVTLQYNGRLKVKGVKATSDAAPEVTYTLLSAATTSDCGKVVCAAGHLHDAKTAVPTGCTAVGILGNVTETGHGLILALQDATKQVWNTVDGWASVTTYAGTTLKQLPAGALGSLTSYTKLGSTTVSDWCVAQKSDYEAIFTNLGSTTGDSDGNTYDDNVIAYITTGVGGTALSGAYWSASEKSESIGWDFGSGCWYNDYKSSSKGLRPVLGF